MDSTLEDLIRQRAYFLWLDDSASTDAKSLRIAAPLPCVFSTITLALKMLFTSAKLLVSYIIRSVI